ncbi:adenylosuccinate lyase [Qingshengfaniella alkalisoli]|uniref:Adenylosuccinate lyase n=1 Tax=Qingshengfaniella alkalisoli TaxID=2599296 RepID=A0A5B8J7A7_9RHOB|nr:adenylosuccinate lyase [Qingshengfaniella alkalisoli]
MVFISAALVFAPVAALACSSHTEANMSCADGMTWDTQSHSCVDKASS